ncbi:MAG TPA: AMP-binding protein, partial [Candidatus Polarisedimenticolia bacterium]|nr:AMP-binding protein [Candidatus Polarisedimenticolia bacterium]
MPELLQDWVTLQAGRRPDAPAVLGGTDALTYGGLEDLSNRVASALKEEGCLKGDRVCLLMPKSPTAIACLLGIYKADCLYVPLDPGCPALRLGMIIASCESRFILAAGPVGPILDEALAGPAGGPPPAVGWMDARPPVATSFKARFDLSGVLSRPARPIRCRNTREDPAHILFTSGSSGTPKGVVVTHDSVIRFVEWARDYFSLGSSDRLSGHPPLHFELSFLDVFGAFAAGAELHLVPSELSLSPHKLGDFIRSRRLTQWFSVPA